MRFADADLQFNRLHNDNVSLYRDVTLKLAKKKYLLSVKTTHVQLEPIEDVGEGALDGFADARPSCWSYHG